MQGAVARYQGEGISCIYVACTGTNAQRLIDLLKNMFGDLDEPDLEELEMDTMKSLCEQAAAAEKADVQLLKDPFQLEGSLMWLLQACWSP